MRRTLPAVWIGILALAPTPAASGRETTRPGMQEGRAAAVAAPLPDGLYASRQRVVSRARTRPRGRLVTVATTALVLHEVRREQAQVRVLSRYCAVRQDPLGNVRTHMGPGFVDAVPEWEAPARVEGPVGGPWRVDVEERTVVLGADLADALREALPVEADDPRVRDPDLDGHPGVTVGVSGFVSGEVYLVQRLIRGLQGTLEPGGEMRGVVTGRSDQEVVGASNPIIRAFTPRFQQDPDPETSLLEWVPVEANTTCAQLIASETILFGTT